ncbi:MAG: VOC family protein [Devosia sp.]
MTVKTTPHLNFRGDARAALQFYAGVFGGEPVIVTYGDAGVPVGPEAAAEVLWGQVATPDGFAIMAYDVPAHLDWNQGQIPFFVSLRGEEAGEIERYWRGLAEGATIVQPLGASGWSKLYGMLKDRFGVTWVFDLQPAG